MKRIATIGAALLIGSLFITLSACSKEGPAEQAGKEIDNAVEKTGENIEKAGDDIKDAAQGDKK